ncbi:hypothetical protein JCM8202v2_004086 [Rhodotorula sphaerocarpa]
MSSQKSSKTDLLVRVRYQNPLPAPPFPPKLLHIGTTPQRYATYDFLAPIQSERELPMILDAELGMPLEPGKAAPGGATSTADYWLGNRSAPPEIAASAALPDEDAFLLEEPDRTNAGSSNPASGPGTPGRANVTDVSKKVDVSWLRKTEYLSSEAGSRQALQALNGNVKAQAAELDPLDRDGRAAAIAATFDAAHVPLSELRHPTKRGVTAVESFDLLPDDDLWPLEYDLVRFGEDPTNIAPNEPPRLGPDPRLPRAIFRDLSDDFPEGQGRVAYYLPVNDEAATLYTEKRYSADESAEGENFEFQWVRDYELTGLRQLTQEFVFSFDAGEDATDGEARVKPLSTAFRPKGVYYTPIETAKQLRKRRPNRGDRRGDVPEGVELWDLLRVSLHEPEGLMDRMAPAEGERWRALKAEVSGPVAAQASAAPKAGDEERQVGDANGQAGDSAAGGEAKAEGDGAPSVVEAVMGSVEENGSEEKVTGA